MKDQPAWKPSTAAPINGARAPEELPLRLYARVLESVTDGVSIANDEGIILYTNPAQDRIFGYAPGELIGQHLSVLGITKAIEQLKTGGVWTRECCNKRKDGTEFQTFASISTEEFSGVRFFVCVQDDITDQQRRFELQERLAAIVESSDDAIIGKDLNGIIRSWNKGAERIFGYTAEEIIGKPVTTLAVPERVEEIPNIIERIRRGERVDHYLTKRITKGGRVLTISLTVSPIKDDSGKIIGASKVARDVTERERAEEMLRAANAALRRANADLEQFAYAAAHDLKEPLRMVSIYCQMLARDFKDAIGPDGQKYLQYSIEGARRMNALVQDLLAYVQASQIQTDVVPDAIDSNVALKHALANLQVTIDESGASISAGNLLPVNMHEVHLEQIFQNLLGNAMKYRSSAAPEIVVASRKAGSETVFSVKDNGIGIPPEYKEQIFELFKRLHPNERYSGSGIGLGICKRIVEHYGGRIWVESDVGRGSTFFFTVPAAGSAGGKQG